MLATWLSNPLWLWLIVAALLLTAELATGTGWLLWPAACAAAVALLTLTGLTIGAPWLVVIFAGLTIVTTLFARRFIPDVRLRPGPDINDRQGELVGKSGKVVQAFVGGEGRVMVDGAEWVAEAEAPLGAGDVVEVVRVLGGAKLAVKAKA